MTQVLDNEWCPRRMLRDLRRRAGLTQYALARSADVNASTICHFERGRAINLSGDAALAIADALLKHGIPRPYVDQWQLLAGYAPPRALDAYLGKYALAKAEPTLRNAIARAFFRDDLGAIRKALHDFRTISPEPAEEAPAELEVAATH